MSRNGDTMRALVLSGPRRLALERRPRPRPAQDEALIRVRYSSICGSDLKLLTGEIAAPYPLVPGHEMSGEVVAAGQDFEHLVGKRVVPDILYPCGRCDSCRRGLPNLCRQLVEHGFTLDGGWAEYLIGKAKNLHVLPDSVSLHEACLIEPLAVVLYALDRVPVRSGERVLVVGAGGIGQLLAQAARRAGARDIVLADRIAARLHTGRRLGADRVVDVSAEDLVDVMTRDRSRAPDVVFEASGDPAVVRQALEIVRPGGRVGLIGFSSEGEARIRPSTIVVKLLDVVGILSPTGTWARAVELVASGRIRLEPLISHTLPLEAYDRAIGLAEEKGDGALRVALQL